MAIDDFLNTDFYQGKIHAFGNAWLGYGSDTKCSEIDDTLVLKGKPIKKR